MALGPENYPQQESLIEAEKPRTGPILLATRTHIGKLLKESPHSRTMDAPISIRQLQSTGTEKDILSLRYLLEYGREEALKYSLRHETSIEDELNLEEKVAANEYLKIDGDIRIKTPQEVMKAKIIIGRHLDITTMENYLLQDPLLVNNFYSIDLQPNRLDVLGIQSIDQFVRVAGFYQGLSFLLGMKNDGGMADLIDQADVNDFKIPAHP